MESWKLIERFEAYAVSDLGRVRRVRLDSLGRSTHVGRVLKPSPIAHGYFQIALYKGGKRRRKTLHVIVAEAFVPNPFNLPQVNHLGSKSDNRAIKLEWRSTAGHGRDSALRNQKGSGIHFNKKARKWYAGYSPKPNKQVHLGTFSTEQKARAARRAAIAGMPRIE